MVKVPIEISVKGLVCEPFNHSFKKIKSQAAVFVCFFSEWGINNLLKDMVVIIFLQIHVLRYAYRMLLIDMLVVEAGVGTVFG